MPPFFFCGNLFDEYLLRLPLDCECNIKIDDILAAAHRASFNKMFAKTPKNSIFSEHLETYSRGDFTVFSHLPREFHSYSTSFRGASTGKKVLS